MTREKRVPLFQRLPEIYRIKDAEQQPPDQLRAYLELVEDAFGAIHENIESLYHDLFIETCDDWVIPYIGDLLGTSHLSGEARTLRADVADTIALRRRKGTLSAIELLTYNLTTWGVHCVELRENLVWNQHLNHQRPDDGGRPPYRDSRPGDPNPNMKPQTVIRGGTATLRDPALLTLLNTPFDPFAHVADLRPPANGSIRYNLPNLAIFLWRLAAYRIRVTRPVFKRDATALWPGAGTFTRAVRFSINPVDRPYLSSEQRKEPVRLFNSNLVALDDQRTTGLDRQNHSSRPFAVSLIDQTPGPIPTARLTAGAPAGVPSAYVSINTYDHTVNGKNDLPLTDVGLQLHLPQSEFGGETFPGEAGQPPHWKIRGANLCAWEKRLRPPLADQEIVIDPVIGRFIVGVGTDVRAQALVDHLLVTYTYGAVGPVGAHPISRPDVPSDVDVRWVTSFPPVTSPLHIPVFGTLAQALKGIDVTGKPVVIEIQDSLVHELKLTDLVFTSETLPEGSEPTLRLKQSLTIRAADNQRPIVELVQPLRFRPVDVASSNAATQILFDAAMSHLTVRLEGLYLTRGRTFPAGSPLITRAALNSLEIVGCTLDPAGYQNIHGDPEGVLPSLRLEDTYGFVPGAERTAFKEIPEIVLHNSSSGPLLVDSLYRLDAANSIIDAGQGVDDKVGKFAVTSATGDPARRWGPPTSISSVTVLGRMRVESIEGSGGIWVHALEVFDHQKGCIKFSYFSNETAAGGVVDILPRNHGCVKGTQAKLRFKSERFGNPAYCQLARSADFRIREQGPDGNEMGAFGSLLKEAHKWRNLQIRFREFMPVGIRPLLLPIT